MKCPRRGVAERVANRAQRKGSGETEDYGSPLKNWGIRKLEICCSHLVRGEDCHDYVNTCLIIVIKCIHRKFEVWSGQQIRRKIAIEKTVSSSSQEEGVCHIRGGKGRGHLEKNWGQLEGEGEREPQTRAFIVVSVRKNKQDRVSRFKIGQIE